MSARCLSDENYAEIEAAWRPVCAPEECRIIDMAGIAEAIRAGTGECPDRVAARAIAAVLPPGRVLSRHLSVFSGRAACRKMMLPGSVLFRWPTYAAGPLGHWHQFLITLLPAKHHARWQQHVSAIFHDSRQEREHFGLYARMHFSPGYRFRPEAVPDPRTVTFFVLHHEAKHAEQARHPGGLTDRMKAAGRPLHRANLAECEADVAGVALAAARTGICLARSVADERALTTALTAFAGRPEFIHYTTPALDALAGDIEGMMRDGTIAGLTPDRCGLAFDKLCAAAALTMDEAAQLEALCRRAYRTNRERRFLSFLDTMEGFDALAPLARRARTAAYRLLDMERLAAFEQLGLRHDACQDRRPRLPWTTGRRLQLVTFSTEDNQVVLRMLLRPEQADTLLSGLGAFKPEWLRWFSQQWNILEPTAWLAAVLNYTRQPRLLLHLLRHPARMQKFIQATERLDELSGATAAAARTCLGRTSHQVTG